MVMVINKRIKRVLFENKTQYIGSVLLIILSSFLFTNLLLVSGNLNRLMKEYETRYVLEDASFTTDKSIDNIQALETAADAVIEEGKSFDYPLSEGVTLRIFTQNDKINLPAILEGNRITGSDGATRSGGATKSGGITGSGGATGSGGLPLQSNGILLSPTFAAAHNYKIGDVLTILDKPFKVVGLMTLPTYIYPLKSETDLLYSPQSFGIAVISKADFAALGKGSNFYAVKYNHPEAHSRAQAAKLIGLLKSRGIGIIQWTDIGVNVRVSGAVAKFSSAGIMGRVVPTVLYLLTAVLLGNVIGRMIKRESAIAGALYALGYKRKEIYAHYLTFPLVIGVIGGIIGTALGLFTMRPMLDVYFKLFEIPMTGIEYSPIILLISLLLPVIFLGASSWLIIQKELKHSPVELMKGDQEKSQVNFLERRFKLEKLKFAAKFQIREQFRSLSRLALLLTGCAAATLLLLFGFFLKSGVDYFLETEVKNGQNYRYEYVFENLRMRQGLAEPVPSGAEPFAVSTFLLQGDDNKVFHVAGVLPDSNISTLVDESGARLSTDQIIITRPIADTLHVKPGDTITIIRKSDYQEFPLKVDCIAASYNMSIFMPLAQYNATFGLPEGSYNELFSNQRLSLPENEPYKVYSIDEKIAAIQSVMAPLTSTVGFIALIAFLIGMIIIYVVTSMMVEENKNTISLMKIFGYRKKEINALVLNSSTMVVVVGYLLGILLCFALVRGLLKALENSLTFAMPVRIEPLYLGIGFIVVMLCYELSKLMCRKKINTIPMSEALKTGME